MKFVSIGISHWNSPVKIREKFSFSDKMIKEIILTAQNTGIEGIFIMSTCNRSQLFAYTDEVDYLKDLFVKYSRADRKEFDRYAIVKTGDEAVKHLFEISVGLDSQILGDIQIIGQLKKAVAFAESLGAIKGNLQRLVQFVYQCFKRVRSSTELNSGTASVAHGSLLLMKKHFASLSDKKVLLFGIGKIGKTTCEHLLSQGIENLTVMNRTFEKAEEIASKFNLKVAAVKDLTKEIDCADIILVTTGSLHPTIVRSHLKDKYSHHKLILDLSVPRNVDPEVNKIQNVDVIDMDNLKNLHDTTFRKRQSAIPKAKEIINEHILDFNEWLYVRSISPTIHALKNKLDEIRKKEIDQYMSKLTSSELEHIELLSKSIVNRIANRTINHLKEKSRTTPETESMISEMFGLRA